MEVAVLKKPKKKMKKWPIVLLISLLLIIVLPIALVYIFIYDPNTKNIDLKPNVTMQSIGNRIMVDSLDKAEKDNKIHIQATEEDMDNVLHFGMEKAGKNPVIKKAYLYVNENRYNFYVDLDLTVLKTRVKVFTTMEESEDKSSFNFKINDITLGQVSGLNGPMSGLLKRIVNGEMVTSFIKSAGLSLKFDSEKMLLIYDKSDIMKDITSLTGNSSDSLYFNIMDTMLTQEMFKFDINKSTFIEGDVDLSLLETNDLVTDDEAHLKIQPSEVVSEVKDKLVTMVNEGDLEPNDQNLKTAFKFLFNGYQTLTDEQKEYIDDIDFTLVDIDENSEYKGFNLSETATQLVEKMKTTVDTHALVHDHSLDVCYLSEEDVNNYAAGRNIVGHTTLLHRLGEDGKYKINFITIDNFYINLYTPITGPRTGEMIAEMVCKINVNGFHTSLTFDTTLDEQNEEANCMVFNVDQIKFGSIGAENLKDDFFAIIDDALNGAGSDPSLKANKDDYTITLDFNQIIEYSKAQVKTELQNAGQNADVDAAFAANNLDYTIFGEDRSSDGLVKIKLLQPLH